MIQPEFILMKDKDILPLKKKLFELNDGVCPLLGIKVPLEKTALDHIHKLKNQDYSEQKGTIRNAIEFRANAIEGKITNAWKRLFGYDEEKYPISLPNFLRNLADYLEKGAYHENNIYFVHPTEVPKVPKLSKRNYNTLKRLFTKDTNNYKSGKLKKFPSFPTSGKLTKDLEILFTRYNINPFN